MKWKVIWECGYVGGEGSDLGGWITVSGEESDLSLWITIGGEKK